MDSPGKISYLESMRGVAAFIVFLMHLVLTFYPAYFTYNATISHLNGLELKYSQSLWSIFSNGSYMVIIFFNLSGYVLSRRYFQQNDFEVLVSGAYRRYIRLFVPVAFTILFSFILLSTGCYGNHQVTTFSHSEWFASMWNISNPVQTLFQCLFYDTMFSGNNAFSSPMWTISVEFYYSLFVFSILAITHNSRRKHLFFIICFFVAISNEYYTVCNFLFGISLNYVEQYRGFIKKSLRFPLAIMILALGIFLAPLLVTESRKCTIYESFPALLRPHSYFIWNIGAYCMVLPFVLSTSLQRAISIRPFRFLGRISYSFYLIHLPIIGSLGSFLFLYTYGKSGGYYNRAAAVASVLCMLVSFVLSSLMTRYVDGPGIRLSKNIYERYFKKRDKDRIPDEHESVIVEKAG